MTHWWYGLCHTAQAQAHISCMYAAHKYTIVCVLLKFDPTVNQNMNNGERYSHIEQRFLSTNLTLFLCVPVRYDMFFFLWLIFIMFVWDICTHSIQQYSRSSSSSVLPEMFHYNWRYCCVVLKYCARSHNLLSHTDFKWFVFNWNGTYVRRPDFFRHIRHTFLLLLIQSSWINVQSQFLLPLNQSKQSLCLILKRKKTTNEKGL